jgi:hypothetical protein
MIMKGFCKLLSAVLPFVVLTALTGAGWGPRPDL